LSIFGHFSVNTVESRLFSSFCHEIFLPQVIFKWVMMIEQVILHDPYF